MTIRKSAWIGIKDILPVRIELISTLPTKQQRASSSHKSKIKPFKLILYTMLKYLSVPYCSEIYKHYDKEKNNASSKKINKDKKDSFIFFFIVVIKK